MDNKKSAANETLLCMGNLTTKLGNQVFDYVANAALAALGASGLKLLAFYQSSETFCSVIMNLYGGAKADKQNKKNLLVLTDAICAIACFALALVARSFDMKLALIIVNIILAIVSSFNGPTVKGIIVEVVTTQRIPKFNSILHLLTEFVKISGPIVGLFIINIFGVFGSFVFNGITFAVSAIMELFLRPINDVFLKNKKANTIQQIKEGFLYLKEHPLLMEIIIASAFVNFLLAGYNLYLPFLNDYVGKNTYAILASCGSAGGMIGSLLSIKFNIKSHVGLLRILGITGIPLIIMGVILKLQYNLYTTAVCVTLFMLALSIYNIAFMSFVQINTDTEYVGRVFSIVFSVSIMFMPLGSIFFSALGFKDTLLFTVIGAGILVIALFTLFHLRVQTMSDDIKD